jgi:energy-coupling factor transport system ATP-binding protein
MGSPLADPPGGSIHAREIAFRYATRPAPAFEGVSFDLAPGQCLLVVGPSGSGKSTLALALAGLVPRELPGEWRGTLEVDGLDPLTADGWAMAARVGLVFQDPESQLVMERVEDDVAFGLESRGWDRAAMAARVPEALAEAGLAGLERRRTARLSGGQQQRLALAGVLAPRPGILVLDEPTANLDPDGARDFAGRLASIRAARAATIVLVEHRVDVAWPLADLVLALGADGRPIDVGTPAAVLARSGAAIEASGSWLPGTGPGSAGRGADRRAAAASVRRPPGPLPDRPIVEARDLRFDYDGVPALRGVDVAIRPGERVALVGANGSGKSTLARLLVGLLRPRSGTVRLGGIDPARLRPRDLARLAGFVFQDPEAQFTAARVRDEVMAGLGGAENVARRDAIGPLMGRVGLPLDGFGDRSPYALSGGEQRRLSLVPALVRSPRVLVLDEPTFGQDRAGCEALLAILGEQVAAGTAVIAATHDERFLDAFATRVIRLEGGLVAAGEARR